MNVVGITPPRGFLSVTLADLWPSSGTDSTTSKVRSFARVFDKRKVEEDALINGGTPSVQKATQQQTSRKAGFVQKSVVQFALALAERQDYDCDVFTLNLQAIKKCNTLPTLASCKV